MFPTTVMRSRAAKHAVGPSTGFTAGKLWVQLLLLSVVTQKKSVQVQFITQIARGRAQKGLINQATV